MLTPAAHRFPRKVQFHGFSSHDESALLYGRLANTADGKQQPLLRPGTIIALFRRNVNSLLRQYLGNRVRLASVEPPPGRSENLSSGFSSTPASYSPTYLILSSRFRPICRWISPTSCPRTSIAQAALRHAHTCCPGALPSCSQKHRFASASAMCSFNPPSWPETHTRLSFVLTRLALGRETGCTRPPGSCHRFSAASPMPVMAHSGRSSRGFSSSCLCGVERCHLVSVQNPVG